MYPEQTIGCVEADEITVNYGKRLVYRNFIDEPFVGTDAAAAAVTENGSTTNKNVYEAKANANNKGVDVTMIKADSSWKYPNLFPVNFTLNANNTYNHVAKMTVSETIDISSLMATVNKNPLDLSFKSASYGGVTTSVSARSYTAADAEVDGDYYIKTFTVDGDAKAYRMSIGGTQDTTGTIIVESLGMYYKPKAAVENAATVDVDIVTGKVTVTYPEGIDLLTLKSILTYPTAIDGVLSAEHDGNSIIFTVERDIDITIPALVNADGTATYAAQTFNCHIIDKNAVYYGERWFYRNFAQQPLDAPIVYVGERDAVASDNTTEEKVQYTVYEVTNNPGIGIDFIMYDSRKPANGGNGFGEWKYPPMMTGTYKLDPGYTYSLAADMDIGTATPTKLMPMFGSTAWFAAGLKMGERSTGDYLSAGNYAKSFTVTESVTKYSMGIGATDASTGTATIKTFGLYRKPGAKIDTVYSVDRDTNTITVKYPQGIYDVALRSLIAEPTMIPGVISLDITDDEFVFKVQRDKNITIPAFVNAALTGTYEEINVIIESADPFAVWFGVRFKLENFDNKTSADFPTNDANRLKAEVIDRADGGKAFKVTSVSNDKSYPFVTVIKEQVTYDFANNNYTLFVENIEDNGLLTRLGIDWAYWYLVTSKYFNNVTVLENHGGREFYAETISSIDDIETDAHDDKDPNKTSTISVLTNPADAGKSYTIDNFGIYSRPKEQISATYPLFNGNKVTITYIEGLQEATIIALKEIPGVINGVTNVEFDGETVTYTIDQNVKSIVVPALVNAAGTKTYAEQTISVDKYAAVYGIKVFLQDYSETVSFTRDTLLVTQENGRMRIEMPEGAAKSWGNANIAGAGKVSIKPNRIYSMFADVDVEGNTDILKSMRFGLDGSSEIPVKFNSDSTAWQTKYAGSMTVENPNADGSVQFDHGTVTEFSFDPTKLQNFYYINGGTQTYVDNDENRQNGEYPNSAWYIVLSKTGCAYIDNFGLYYRPAAKESAVKTTVAGNTLSITYANGIYQPSLDAILVYPDVVGADSASYDAETNVLSLTATDISRIYVPALVNANESATYAPVVVAENTEMGMRVSNPTGIRTISKISLENKLVSDEYGYIVTRQVILDRENKTELTFDLGVGNYVSKASYIKSEGRDWQYDHDAEFSYFSGVFTGIKEENYNDVLVFRSYVKVTKNGNTSIIYGEPLKFSVFSAAEYVRDNSTGLSPAETEFINDILAKKQQ